MGNNQESQTPPPSKMTEEEQRKKMENRWANYVAPPSQNSNENQHQFQGSILSNPNSTNPYINRPKNPNVNENYNKAEVQPSKKENKSDYEYQSINKNFPPLNEIKESNDSKPKNPPVEEKKEKENVNITKINTNIVENINNNQNNNSKEATVEPHIEEKKKPVNIEHVSIEKIFQITLDENLSNKYFYLELYKAQLMSSSNVDPSEYLFKLNNLDEIILALINDSKYRDNLVNYFLICYHRAYQIIDIKYRNVLNDDYNTIKLSICTYLSQIIFSPINFELENNSNLTYNNILIEFEKYYNDYDIEEFNDLLNNLLISIDDDTDTMKVIFHYFFIIFDKSFVNENAYNCPILRKNINILIDLFSKNKRVISCYINDSNFLSNMPNFGPFGGPNGQFLQYNSFLGKMLSVIITFECNNQIIKDAFPRNLNENDPSVRNIGNKIYELYDSIGQIFTYLINEEPEKLLNFFYVVINLNFEYTKMNKNIFITSSVGFLLNCFIISCKLLFNECQKEFSNDENYNIKNIKYLIKLCDKININFSFNDKYITFSKFELISSEICNKFREDNKEKSKELNYNKITQLFYITHCLLNYSLPSLEKKYEEIIKNINNLGKNGISEQLKDMFNFMRSIEVIVKNDTFNNLICDLNRLTCIYVLLLNNNQKNIDQYLQSINKNDEDIDTNTNIFNKLIDNLDLSSNIHLSSLPKFIIENLYTSSIFQRKFSSEFYFKSPLSSPYAKELIYFSIIYSSKNELVHNPYIRSQVFDIFLHSFLYNEQEKNKNQIISFIVSILKENFVQINLIPSLVHVFVDAERVGTSNQFYEKFTIRNKVLVLIENLYKNHQNDFKEKIISFATNNNEDIKKMVTLLMSDVNYLKDEVIMKLIDIRQYQMLKNDTEKWNELSEEDKQNEDQKFFRNEQIIKPEMELLNSSLNFLVIICSSLQKFFISLNLYEKLATFLNCCLSEFTSKSADLKIKNKSDYNFKPELIIEALVEIYVAFYDYDEFIDFVVNDISYYNYKNFELAVEILSSKSKVKVGFEIEELFNKFVYEKLVESEKRSKEKYISYDDAPEEFLDSITNELMKDPVMLPKSNVICDRDTIETQLISNPIDPFNRTPLTKDMLIPQVELKERIIKYMEEKKKNKEKNNK